MFIRLCTETNGFPLNGTREIWANVNHISRVEIHRADGFEPIYRVYLNGHPHESFAIYDQETADKLLATTKS